MISLNKNDFMFYLLFLTPFLIIPGIAIIELSCLFLILFFFFKNRNFDYYKNSKFIFLIIFSIYLAINAFFQINDNLRISSFFFFRFCFLSLSIFFILELCENISNKNKANLLFIIILLNIFIFFDSHLQFITGKNVLGFEIIRATISSFFGSELILGSFLIKLLPIISFLFFFSNIDIKKYFFLLTIFFSLFFSVIFIAGGRTPFFLMILFIFLSIFFIKDLRNIFYSSLIILIIYISSNFIFEFGKSNPENRIFTKTFNQITNNFFLKKRDLNLKGGEDVNKIELKKEIKIFSSNHHGHYVLAYKLFKENPIWGIGPKGFRHYCRGVNYDPPIGICSTHPHNFLIQIMLETGLVGLIFYLSAIIFVVLKLFKAYLLKNTSVWKNCFLTISLGLIVNFFPFVPSGNFFNNWISITNYYYVGVYMFSYKKVFNL